MSTTKPQITLDLDPQDAAAIAVLLTDRIELEANPYDPEQDGPWPHVFGFLADKLAEAAGTDLAGLLRRHHQEPEYGLDRIDRIAQTAPRDRGVPASHPSPGARFALVVRWYEPEEGVQVHGPYDSPEEADAAWSTVQDEYAQHGEDGQLCLPEDVDHTVEEMTR